MAQNSMHTDPRTGEILNASIYIHHNYLSLLYSNRCTQTMGADPSVRTLALSNKQMGELLKVGIAQQIGYCLGLTDNMGASYRYPVDSLRSATFTRMNGLTPSVMDNLMCNYVAQPEDVEKGVTMVQPGIGLYDYFSIRYLYAPVAVEKSEQEIALLNKWVENAYSNNEYHYKPRQEFYALYDPSAILWDLGNDPFKAADYQIMNLKKSLTNFMSWYAKDDHDMTRRTELYASLIKLYTYRAMELSFWIGGIYLQEDGYGDNVPVSKEIQKKALNYLVDMSMDLDWLTNEEIKSNLELQDLIVDKTRKYILQFLFDRISYVALCAEKSGNQYSVKDYINDIHSVVWKGVLQNRSLTNVEMQFQNILVDYLVKNISKNIGTTPVGATSARRGLRSETLKMDTFCEATSPVMGWQAQDIVPANSHPDGTVYWDMLLKIRKMLKENLSRTSLDMKEYYEFMIYKIDKILDEN